jgi:hypothetical protein
MGKRGFYPNSTYVKSSSISSPCFDVKRPDSVVRSIKVCAFSCACCPNSNHNLEARFKGDICRFCVSYNDILLALHWTSFYSRCLPKTFCGAIFDVETKACTSSLLRCLTVAKKLSAVCVKLNPPTSHITAPISVKLCSGCEVLR